MNSWQFLACLLSICAIAQAQVQTNCVQGVYTQVDINLYNGLLPTHIAEEILNSGSLQLEDATLLLNNNFTFNANSFVAIVTQESSTITGNATNTTAQDEGQQDGQIQVNNQSVEFEVDFTLTQDNSVVSGIASIPLCDLSYNFTVNFTNTSSIYNLSMLSTDISFEIGNVTRIYPNFPITQLQLTSLINQLNANQTIQEALKNYLGDYPEQFVQKVKNHIPSNLNNFNYGIPSDSESDLTLNVEPIITAFVLYYAKPIQYQIAFQTVVQGISTTPVCSNYTVSTNQNRSKYQQEFYDSAFLQNLFARAIELDAFNTVLNSTNWPIPYLSWFTGGWKSIDAQIYEDNPLDTVLQGNCTLLGYNYNGPNNTSVNNNLLFDFQYNCTLFASANSSVSLQVNLTQVSVALKYVRVGKYNYQIQFYVVKVGYYSTSPSQQQLGPKINWYLKAALGMYEGQNFGDAIPTVLNQGPLFYRFNQSGLQLYSQFANPIPSVDPTPEESSSEESSVSETSSKSSKTSKSSKSSRSSKSYSDSDTSDSDTSDSDSYSEKHHGHDHHHGGDDYDEYKHHKGSRGSNKYDNKDWSYKSRV